MLFLLSLTPPKPAIAPRVLVAGGGPNRRYNQVAIESNVKYFTKMVPKDWSLKVLFGDGDKTKETVRYTPTGETEGKNDKYRVPDLTQWDGPSNPTQLKTEIASLAAGDGSPVLLYFTGHGSIAEDQRPRVSQFDMWGNTRITVPELSESLSAFDTKTPITILMVQCHAGGFAKLLFKNGDPTAPLINQRLCGFYASIEPRYAAGCTSNVNEAYYRDFTTYFVAALTCEDRVGRKVTGADYDHDGKVGMNEAFCWSMVHDDSIDTPVCTSDEFLRDVLKTTDEEVFKTPYKEVLKWASPAQKAALEELSANLKLSGEDRLSTGFQKYSRIDDEDEDMTNVKGFRFLRLAKSVVLGHVMKSNKDATLRKRYEQLLKDESANPLRP